MYPSFCGELTKGKKDKRDKDDDDNINLLKSILKPGICLKLFKEFSSNPLKEKPVYAHDGNRCTTLMAAWMLV